MKVNGALVARLLYLLQKHEGVHIPSPLLRYIPGSNFITALAAKGIGASDVDPNLVQQLIEIGGDEKHPGPGDAQEIITIVQRLVDDHLRTDHRLDLSKRLEVYRMLDSLHGMIDEHGEITRLNDPGEIQNIPLFETGFTPLDTVMGGSIYQGIFVLMGPPGTGKTSLMITMMEDLRKRDWPGSLIYLENEIPNVMMKGRFKPVIERTPFINGDELICYSWNARQLLTYVKDNPDPERIVFFDSPDVMTGSMSHMNSFGKKVFQEGEYLTLIEMKRLCKAIIVSSWPNREKERVEHMNQISDAVEKIRYADGIIGMNPMANDRLQLLCLKNRFGPSDGELVFEYRAEDLTWSAASIEQETDFWATFQQEAQAEAELAETNGRAS